MSLCNHFLTKRPNKQFFCASQYAKKILKAAVKKLRFLYLKGTVEWSVFLPFQPSRIKDNDFKYFFYFGSKCGEIGQILNFFLL